jgi:hypothetical protein
MSGAITSYCLPREGRPSNNFQNTRDVFEKGALTLRKLDAGDETLIPDGLDVVFGEGLVLRGVNKVYLVFDLVDFFVNVVINQLLPKLHFYIKPI